MVDRTADLGVKRDRSVQKHKRRIVRIEVQVPVVAAKDIKTAGRKRRARVRLTPRRW